MSAAEGQEVFLRALALRTPQLAICTKDLRALTAAVREQIADRAEAPVGDIPAQRPEKHQRPPLATPYVPPARDVERVVCRAFEDALGIDDVGVHDSFFDLGGHSLAAVDMMARLNRHFGTTVPVAALYDGLTAAVVAMSFDAHGSKRPELVTSDARRHLNTRQAKASKRRHSRMERRQRP
jgi:acyl carrier protein